jgi:hypothetical protein
MCLSSLQQKLIHILFVFLVKNMSLTINNSTLNVQACTPKVAISWAENPMQRLEKPADTMLKWLKTCVWSLTHNKLVPHGHRRIQLSESEKAKIAQERAISERTLTSSVVVIEEEYHSATDASFGMQGNQNGMDLGVKGSGKRLSKRKITFIK